MAFDWFRRRQKMVMIVMVALMVSFLVGSIGFNYIFQRDPMSHSLGATMYGDIERKDYIQADEDIGILSPFMAGAVEMTPESIEFRALVEMNNDSGESNRAPNAALAYAMLAKEAESKGIKVTDSDVDAFLASLGIAGEKYKEIVAAISRQSDNRINEDRIRQAILRWTVIRRYYAMSFVPTPPSREQIRQAFSQYAEQIAVKQAIVTPEMFMGKVKLSDKEMEAKSAELFKLYCTVAPGSCSQSNQFGFGYLQPLRLKLACLYVNMRAIGNAITINDSQLAEYFRINRSKYAKSASSQARLSDDPEKVRADAAAAAIEDMSSMVMNSLRQAIMSSSGTEDKTYQPIVDSLTASADSVLGRQIGDVAINKLPLKEAMTIIASQARLTAICYPTGQVGACQVNPQMPVSISIKNATLAQVLADVDSQVQKAAKDGTMPGIKWSQFKPIDGVIFPILQVKVGDMVTSDYDFFPISAESTADLSRQELAMNSSLANAREVGGNARLIDMLYGASGQDADTSSASVGLDGPVMEYYSVASSGKLFWRVLSRRAAFVPTEISQMDVDAQARLRDDVKLQAAFALANDYAAKIKDADEFYAAISADKLKVDDVGPFARMTMRIGDTVFPDRSSQEKYVDAAFSLAPESLAVFPPKSADVAVVSLPGLRQVRILQRIGYVVPNEEDFNSAKDGVDYVVFKASSAGESLIKVVYRTQNQLDPSKLPPIFAAKVQVSGKDGSSLPPKILSMSDRDSVVSAVVGQEVIVRFEDELPMYRAPTPVVEGKSVEAMEDVSRFVPNRASIIRILTGGQERMFMRSWFNGASIAVRVDYKVEKE